MREPKVTVQWVSDIPQPLCQVLLDLGPEGDDNDENLRVGTGNTIVSALESLTRGMRKRAIRLEDDRMRELLQGEASDE